MTDSSQSSVIDFLPQSSLSHCLSILTQSTQPWLKALSVSFRTMIASFVAGEATIIILKLDGVRPKVTIIGRKLRPTMKSLPVVTY